jgi:transcriptional regulator with XRE-family HTH domain
LFNIKRLLLFMPKNEIGKALKNYRDRSKLTLSEIATALKVSTTTIVNYETGKRLPDIDFLITFAEATGEDFLYWLGLRIAASQPEGAASVKALLDKANIALGASSSRTGRSFVSLPLYDIKDALNAPPASGYERAADEMLQFSTTWIKRELNATPSDLFLILVDDESMEPTLRPAIRYCWTSAPPCRIARVSTC